jgi:hypothetical protein
MSCPTCDHTLAFVCRQPDSLRVFHCTRCGTLVALDASGDEHATRPKLVDRCREFEKTFPPGNPPSVSYSREWLALGIAESIHRPEERPT